MSSHINIEGPLFIQDTEDGQTNNNIPFEIYSDYSANPTNTYFRQLQFSNVTSGSTYMGVSNVGSYFYISEPSTSPMSAQSDTFIITSAGNVGIGNTNPLVPLHVEGETKVSGSLNVVGDLITTNVYTSNITFGNLVVNGNPNHKIPKGTIALWENSTESTIPKGWTRFDAIDTMFVRGGNTPGQPIVNNNSVNIGLTNFPSHTHNMDNANFASGGHEHNLPANFGVAPNHKHSISISSTSNTGEHAHSRQDRDPYFASFLSNKKTAYWLPDNASWRNFAYNTSDFNRSCNTNENHSHSFKYPNSKNLSDSNNWSHTHNFTSPSNNANLGNSKWTHGSNGDTDSAGGNTIGTNNSSASIIPLYASYVFIIKQ